MAFRGLFIGIDRYAESGINWLSCAKRDATALHALFTDTFGPGADLLVDTNATRAAIDEAFQRLAKAEPDDLVVIAFSGHGSETHELVTHDTEVRNLSGTGIPLKLLADWFARIPAKRVLFILDCCFSGGMGAKALQVDAIPRDVQSADSLLSNIAGEGRVILTATLPTEQAWEIGSMQHGLLTYHLLEALEGAEEVRTAGKVGIYRLFDYVTQRVIASADTIGKKQNPTVRGTIDGALELPVLRRGAIYSLAFPERSTAKVTADLGSLTAYGFPRDLVKAWAESIPALNQLQQDAINDFGLLAGRHVVVSAPTSSGKTMIGELAAVRGSLDRKRALFLFPLKALVNDKQKHFDRVYGPYGIRTVRATGDSTTDDITPLMRGQYDIALLTYEKFAALIVGHPYLLEQVGTVVIDEVQMIADSSRGVNLEFLLTLLRVRRQHGTSPQIIALSAVIGSTNGFEHWLGGRLLSRPERPVPLDEGVLRPDGSFRFIASDTGNETVLPAFIQPEYGKGSSQDLIKPLVGRLVSEEKQVIVFRETRGEARGCANYLSDYLGLPAAQDALDAVSVGDPSLATTTLRKTLAGGVAFHISDLDSEERLVVEEHFRTRPTALRVIAATTTLAMGINTPAEAVIIAGLEHPGDPPAPYSVAEYKNMAGRAGRLGYSERGTSFLVVKDGMEERRFWNTYVLGKPEDLQSRFLARGTDPRSVVLRILVALQSATRTAAGMTQEEIIEFLEASFAAYQQRSATPDWKWDKDALGRAFASLKEHGLIEEDASTRLHITQLGRFPGESGVEVETIVRVVSAIQGTSGSDISDPALISLTQLATELDRIFLPMHRNSPQEAATWFGELRSQGVTEGILHAMQRNVSDSRQATLRAKRAGACLLLMTDLSMEDIESRITRFWGKFDGAAGQVRSTRSRTIDLLPVIARVVEVKNPGVDLDARVRKLLVRLELGIPSAMVELGIAAGTRLSRADYLALHRDGFRSIDKIRETSDEELLVVLENNASKLATMREAVVRHDNAVPVVSAAGPILPAYES